MEATLELLKNFEGILTLIAVMISLGTLAVGFIAVLFYAKYIDNKEETYKKYNLEFMDRQVNNEMNYLRRLYTDNACEINKLKDEIQKLNKKASKRK